MHKTLLLTISLLALALSASADAYDKLWLKATKAQAAAKTQQARSLVDKAYGRALKEGNTLQWTRAMYAYDALGVTLTEDSVVANAKRAWTARRMERNSVQHALLTHLLGRLTDNDYLLALSIADTTFLREQRVVGNLPLVKGYTLFDVFNGYLRQRDMPDSVFVGWQRPMDEDTTTAKHYNFGNDLKAVKVPAEGDIDVTPIQVKKKPDPGIERTTPGSGRAQTLVKVSGDYKAHVFNIPGGMSRTSLFEERSGRPVKQWALHRSDGRGQENDIAADGNGHVWQRPTQIHDYDGIYAWSLQALTEGNSRTNTLKASDYHATGWSHAEHNDRELRLEIQSHDAKTGSYGVTLYAPHRNLTLLRDITSGGRLVEQRRYEFSDFIHFSLKWREAWGDEALVTFAYMINGHLYTTEMRIARPKQ